MAGLWPGSYLLAEVRLNAALHGFGIVMLWFLTPPAWFLLALPGVILAWTCRPNRQLSPMAEEELREHEVSLFLYDELAREARKWAREEGDTSNDDDRMPTHDLIDLFGVAMMMTKRSILNSIRFLISSSRRIVDSSQALTSPSSVAAGLERRQKRGLRNFHIADLAHALLALLLLFEKLFLSRDIAAIAFRGDILYAWR